MSRAVPWLFLAAAIASEICATLGLRAVAGHRSWPAIALVTLGYIVSFVCLAGALQQLKVGVVYAIWSAVGTSAVAVAGARLFGDRLGGRAIVGIVLIVAGVIVLTASGARHGGAAATSVRSETHDSFS